MRVDLAVIAGAEDVPPDHILLAQRLNAGVQLIADIPKFAAQINVDCFGLYGVGADQRAFDQLIGVLFHNFAVFESAGLAFIGIDRDVFDRFMLGDEAPFYAGGEAGAPAPAQAGSLDHINDFGRRHGQRLLQAGEAVVFFVSRQLFDVGYVATA